MSRSPSDDLAAHNKRAAGVGRACLPADNRATWATSGWGLRCMQFSILERMFFSKHSLKAGMIEIERR